MKFNLEENALMITYSISVFKGKTQSWLEQNIDWLKNISCYGVTEYLKEAERRGFIKSKSDGLDNEVIYFATNKGINTYNKDSRFQ
jgi:hypothetical protein